jgi:hypothetical protein
VFHRCRVSRRHKSWINVAKTAIAGDHMRRAFFGAAEFAIPHHVAGAEILHRAPRRIAEAAGVACRPAENDRCRNSKGRCRSEADCHGAKSTPPQRQCEARRTSGGAGLLALRPETGRQPKPAKERPPRRPPIDQCRPPLSQRCVQLLKHMVLFPEQLSAQCCLQTAASKAKAGTDQTTRLSKATAETSLNIGASLRGCAGTLLGCPLRVFLSQNGPGLKVYRNPFVFRGQNPNLATRICEFCGATPKA